jgi:hypothetical protein
VGVLENALRASGGLDLWRLTRRFIVHMSITGDLCSTKCSVRKRAINIAIPLGEIPIDIIAGKQYFKRSTNVPSSGEGAPWVRPLPVDPSRVA